MSEIVGFTTESVQKLRFAGEQLNIAQRTVDQGLQRFSRRLGEAAEGGGELLKIVQKYDVQLRDSNGQLRTNSALLRDFADIIADTKDEQEQLRIAFKLFDSEGAGHVRLLREGGSGLDDFGEKAKDAGVVIDSQLIENAAEADRVFNEMKQTIDAKPAEAVADNADAIRELGEVIAFLKKEAIEAIGPTLAFINGVRTGIQGLANLVDRFTEEEEVDPLTSITEDLTEAQKKLSELRRLQANLPQRQRTPRFEKGLAEQIATQEQRVNEILAERKRLFDGLAKRRKAEMKANIENAEALRALKETEKKIVRDSNGLLEIDLAQLYVDARRPLRQFNAELRKAKEEQDALKAQAQQLGFTFSSAFEDAIVSGNKLRDVLKGLLQDLARIFVRKTITEPAGKFLAGLFTLKGKALGGPVAAGVPHTVGERGRELFVPDQSGTIVPNHALGGGGPAVVNHISVTGAEPERAAQLIEAAAEEGSSRAVSAILDLRQRRKF